MKEKNVYERIISGEELSFDEKLKITKGLVAGKVARILQKEIAIAKLSGRQTKIELKAKDCIDDDENIRKYLEILGARNVKVSSDFPGYNETYEGTTKIEFSY